MAVNAYNYGFVKLEHLMDERVTTVGSAVVWEAVQQSAAAYSREVDALVAGFIERTTDASRRFYGPGGGTLQPLDEYGNPLPVMSGGYYDVAFPIQGGGTAWGNNRVTRGLMTVREADRFTLDATRRDADWMKRHILAALLTKTTWAYSDPLLGSLTIQPLANGDAVTYPLLNGTTATDNHYTAQAAAIADGTNPFPTLYTELAEHPGNTGPFVCYIPTANRAATEALTNFVAVNDPDLLIGADTTSLRGGIVDRGMGDEVLGKTDKLWIIEWKSLPDNYLLGHARGAGAALAMREYASGALQGFFAENHSPDGNLLEHRFIRYAGFGALNRVAAAAVFVGAGDAVYDNQASYTAPLAV